MKKNRIILSGLLFSLYMISLCGCSQKQMKKEEIEINNLDGQEEEKQIGSDGNQLPEQIAYRVENGTVIFEEGITKISRDMFHASSDVLYITLPDSIEEIEHGSFASSKLISIDMSAIKCQLDEYMFEDCYDLERVILPEGLERISYAFFCDCERLKEIHIPASVYYISTFAFNNCESLEYVEFGENVNKIGMKAFLDCTSMRDVELPKQLEIIGECAFQRCFEFEYITIPEKVSLIEMGAFIDCKKLKAVTIGKCETFEEDVFSGCHDLVIYGLEGTPAQTYAKENNIPFELLSMKEEAVTLKANDTYQLELNSKGICDWSTSDEAVVSVDENGMVTANKAGKAIVTASIYGENFTCEVTVE